jgi:hypothetical protein
MTEPRIVESGISPTLYCPCGLPTTYHKRDDGTTLYRCDFCDLLVGHSRTVIEEHP